MYVSTLVVDDDASEPTVHRSVFLIHVVQLVIANAVPDALRLGGTFVGVSVYVLVRAPSYLSRKVLIIEV